ncbi:hypothetical protein [Algibacter pectinivorans]|uniref:Uncharacterized protein n=1 Tax=Algibacter pectinivorans TaxID=870482 RepID=A0A1I1SCE2_9FLAO|nr:hypothetical protein [Algibacter pectinivorans]SFD41533.1 hypothetical protein SAMN04487987_11316 [Algibacter pectinivorans]
MNTENKEELEKQESEIRKNLFLVFVPIAIMIFIIANYQSNSLEHNKEKYLESRNTKFNGIVIKKRQEGDYTRAGRFVILDNYHEERVENNTYYRIQIGDSVYKKSESDSVYFHLKNGEIIIEDYNEYLRKNYYELLNEK